MKKKLIINVFMFLCVIASSGFLIYELSLLNNIENTLRLIIRIMLVIIDIVIILFSLKFIIKKKKVKNLLMIIFMLIYIILCCFVAYNIDKVYSSLKKVSDSSEYTTYSSSLVTLSTNEVNSIDEIGKENIGILEDETNYESNIIPLEVISKKELSNKIDKYVSSINMIDDLLSGEIKYIFLPTNYTVMYSSTEGYEDLKDKTKIIYTKTKKVKKASSDTAKNSKKVTEPFTILLMGVDSENEGIEGSSFNGDSLMVITFNPKTLSATMLSIPRDSYVPITCFTNKRKNKITHAAWHGESCMIDTIENFLSVDIDYYVKINFKGVVSLVDNLGGVDIDVPYSLCEQDSNRRWGSNTVYIKEGQQTLNGEQALAYARNRHPNPTMCSSEWTNYTSNDFVRGQHQQEIVTALLDKLKSVKSLDTVYKLLDTISNNMSTNMTTNQILSLYNIVKDMAAKSSGNHIDEMFQIQRLYINGYDQRIVDVLGSGLELYNYVPYEASVSAVTSAMKINLGEKKEEEIKKFSFNINTPYEEKVIGKTETSKSSLVLLPSFVGNSLSYAQSFCSANGIKVNVKYVMANGTDGTVTSQSISPKANVEDVSSITLNVIQNGKTTVQKEEKTETKIEVAEKEETKEEVKEENTENESVAEDEEE